MNTYDSDIIWSKDGRFLFCYYTRFMTTTVQSTKPLKRLAVHATTTCASQASVYGKCILVSYTDVHKDICKDEFAKFGQCLREAVGIRFYISLLAFIFVFQMKRKW